MATDRPRFTVSVTDEMLEDVERYRQQQGLATRSGAVQELLRLGIEELRRGGAMEERGPDLPPEVAKVAEGYAALDAPGKSLIRVVLSEEAKRVKAQNARRRERARVLDWADEEAEPRTIPHYFTPAAAGYASPVFDEDYVYMEVGGQVPPYADFAVDIDGDSMEPYILNGATVYVNRDPLEDGDVGIFCVDGDMLCKQYHRDQEGGVHLLSLNRARADADRYIPPDAGISLICFGRVILPHRLRLVQDEARLRTADPGYTVKGDKFRLTDHGGKSPS